MPIKYRDFFSGIGGFAQALHELRSDAQCYSMCENDKWANKVLDKRFPGIPNLGDIKEVNPKTLEQVDLMMGGFPCTDLSIQKGKDRQGLGGSRSGLFFQFLQIIKQSKPSYFLIENVASMSKANKALITEMVGVDPIEINSGLVSAQNRKRLYWCNWKVPLPEDKELTLMDIKVEDDFKYAYSWSKSYRPVKWGHPSLLEGTLISPDDKAADIIIKPASFDERIRFDGKANSLTTSINGTESLNFYTKEQLTFKPRKVFKRHDMLPYNLGEKGVDWRPINLIECARLQTFPDNWCEGISNHQQYKRFGNAVTKDAVKHILSFCPGVNNGSN